MGFGMLRVLNDDWVAPGMGFGTHPHQNMEIISIPISGTLEHKDSMGTVSVIEAGDIQVMSAGTGIHHSEINKSKKEPVSFLQIWVIPEEQDVEPRYQQLKLAELLKPNELSQVLSPNEGDPGVWIHQQAYFSMGRFNQETATAYPLKNPEHGVYLFVLEGQVSIEGKTLGRRDAAAISNAESIAFTATDKTEVLLMEIPIR